MAENINIDIENATDDELLRIRNQIIKRLAIRSQNPSLRADYDRHGSGHSRSTPLGPKFETVLRNPE